MFVTEAVRLLIQTGELEAEKLTESRNWVVRIPEGVREVIGKRLDRLSDKCGDTLTAAAILGREFTFHQLNALMQDITETRLLEILDEVLAAGVMEDESEILAVPI